MYLLNAYHTWSHAKAITIIDFSSKLWLKLTNDVSLLFLSIDVLPLFLAGSEASKSPLSSVLTKMTQKSPLIKFVARIATIHLWKWKE
jgi:hypothetical protein